MPLPLRSSQRLHSTSSRRGAVHVLVLVILWSMGVVGGCGVLLVYGHTAGPAGVQPASWPEDSTLVPGDDRPTLVMFIHPRCPCTRASLGELARLTSTCGERLATIIALHQPPSQPAEWAATTLRAMADDVPHTVVVLDTDAREAQRFGATTSGHVVLYDGQGRKAFSGGITAARGHEGGNAGRSAIERLVAGAPADRVTTPVFGCPLRDADQACCEKESS